MFDISQYARETCVIAGFCGGLWLVGLPSGYVLRCFLENYKRRKRIAARWKDQKLVSKGVVIGLRDCRSKAGIESQIKAIRLP